MKTKQRAEIRREIHEIRVVRLSRGTDQADCTRCGAKVPHCRVEQAAAALSISESAMFRLAESGRLHSTESDAGSLLICGNSLAEMSARFGKRD